MNTLVSDKAGKVIGPYSHAVIANGFIFCAGQTGVTSEDILKEGIEDQTRQAILNITTVLLECGSDLEHVVDTTVFLKQLEDFNAMNAIYATMFGNHKPARATVQIAKLPKDALIEIKVIAVIK